MFEGLRRVGAREFDVSDGEGGGAEEEGGNDLPAGGGSQVEGQAVGGFIGLGVGDDAFFDRGVVLVSEFGAESDVEHSESDVEGICGDMEEGARLAVAPDGIVGDGGGLGVPGGRVENAQGVSLFVEPESPRTGEHGRVPGQFCRSHGDVEVGEIPVSVVSRVDACGNFARGVGVSAHEFEISPRTECSCDFGERVGAVIFGGIANTAVFVGIWLVGVRESESVGIVRAGGDGPCVGSEVHAVGE